MTGPKAVSEPRVVGAGEDNTHESELLDVTQPLKGGRVNDADLNLAEWNGAVNGVGNTLVNAPDVVPAKAWHGHGLPEGLAAASECRPAGSARTLGSGRPTGHGERVYAPTVPSARCERRYDTARFAPTPSPWSPAAASCRAS